MVSRLDDQLLVLFIYLVYDFRLDDQDKHLRSILENLNTNPTISKSGTIQDTGYRIQDTGYRIQGTE